MPPGHFTREYKRRFGEPPVRDAERRREAADRVFFEPGEDHWHGAAPNRFMTHLAMQEVDEQGSPVEWSEHVTEEEYGAAPSIDG